MRKGHRVSLQILSNDQKNPCFHGICKRTTSTFHLEKKPLNIIEVKCLYLHTLYQKQRNKHYHLKANTPELLVIIIILISSKSIAGNYQGSKLKHSEQIPPGPMQIKLSLKKTNFWNYYSMGCLQFASLRFVSHSIYKIFWNGDLMRFMCNSKDKSKINSKTQWVLQCSYIQQFKLRKNS